MKSAFILKIYVPWGGLFTAWPETLPVSLPGRLSA